jgi:hypothetical protein
MSLVFAQLSHENAAHTSGQEEELEPMSLLLLLLPLLQLFAAPAVGKLLAVAAVALPIIAVGGLAYRKAVGDPDCSWQEALGRTYCVLNNCPGVLYFEVKPSPCV